MQLIHRRDISSGFTLIEMVIAIIVVGIIASVAALKLSETVRTAQFEQTKKELDALATAIAGDPRAYTSGTQAEFGYIGDVGAFPPNLGALVSNPGAYVTWRGPYITGGTSSTDYKTDAWGVAYVYSDSLLRSTGSGGDIDKLVAPKKADLLANLVEGVVTDASMAVPGPFYKDSVWVQLVYPNGVGGMKIDSLRPSRAGAFSFSNIPIGHHTIRIIYKPATDTLVVPVTVYPRRKAQLSVIFPTDLW